jgi:hypothetical protein
MRYHGDRKPAPNPAASHTRPRRILHVFAVRSTDDFDGAFAAAHTAQAEGFVILGGPLLNQNAPRLAALVAQHRLPAIHPNRRFVKAGGLMAYGPKESDSSWGERRAAVFVDKILKGTKPADLPEERPTKFELVITSRPRKPWVSQCPQCSSSRRTKCSNRSVQTPFIPRTSFPL